jgi:hypothetical protein
MLVIAGLPHRFQLHSCFSNRVRKAALDQLHGASHAATIVSGDEHVKMVWHDDEFVNHEFVCIPVSEDRTQQQVRSLRSLEQILMHISRGRYEVRLPHVSPAEAGSSILKLDGNAALKRRTTRTHFSAFSKFIAAMC